MIHFLLNLLIIKETKKQNKKTESKTVSDYNGQDEVSSSSENESESISESESESGSESCSSESSHPPTPPPAAAAAGWAWLAAGWLAAVPALRLLVLPRHYYCDVLFNTAVLLQYIVVQL